MNLKNLLNNIKTKGFNMNNLRGAGNKDSLGGVSSWLGEYYSGILYACVNAIAEEVATLEPVIKTKAPGDEDYEVLTEHPLLDLLYSPNPRQGLYDLIMDTILQLLLTGNAYWLIEAPDVLAQPTGLQLLNSGKVKVNTDPQLSYTHDLSKGQTITYPPEQIVHFMKPDPANEYKGKSPVEAISSALLSDKKAIDHILSVFENKAVPGGILTSKGKLTHETEAKVQEEWNQYKGTSNAGSTILLSGGDFSWQPTAVTNESIQLLQIMDFNMKKIMAHYKVPPTILGIQENSNRATAEANRFTFQIQVVKPQMIQLIQAIAHKLLPRYDNNARTIKLDFKDPVIADKEYKLRELTVAVDRWITVNEAREQSGYPRLEDGSGDTLLRPAGQFALEDVENLPTIPNPLPPEDDSPEDTEV